ncbi:hypothetical protein DNTS_016269 [Danionella cerebrum]|uniref:VWFC domain-containing protein n=1 Tax=Danionella cerebrum TaxID=2873325 RepID=A0A553Q0U9_9TELE|nr:hypothetical protein DNTS_016269 [Danionella translucida]
MCFRSLLCLFGLLNLCATMELELCGGPDWTLGSCGTGFTCTELNGTGLVQAPEAGVCRASMDSDWDVMELCPLVSGCDRVDGQCVCESRQSCIRKYTFPDRETCLRSSRTGSRHHDHRQRQKFVGPLNPACLFSGCNLTAEGCVCSSQSCFDHFTYTDRSQCQRDADERRCTGVKCPSLLNHDCPSDSVPSHGPAPAANCCPMSSPLCVCSGCSEPPDCSVGQKAVIVREGIGVPGNCCSTYTCKAVSPQCVHEGKQFSEGELYRIDPCWLCQCRAGVSFCSKAECAELQCQNYYIPEGECCPVCIEVHLLSQEGSGRSCFESERLRAHEEQWSLDDCTFCQCVDGETHCTAMACKQSCHRPVKIPGECCPYCEEPSYESVSPLLCPPLENCSLSGHECPFGFQQDPSGCLLCQCVSNETCPDISTYCPLECPGGYVKDEYGCEVCDCDVMDTCRPLTCTKTCPHGYMRNKQGCEICRCVKCPPFSCDKPCSHGFKKNRKGCSICQCREGAVSSTSISVTASSSVCVTAAGQNFQDGQSWHDGCRDCFCHDGREMCVLIACPAPTCPSPVMGAQQCCPSCEEESGSGQPDLLVCVSPDGRLYTEGEWWSLDDCVRCVCRQGRVVCDAEVCPPLLCDDPLWSEGSCCPTCPDSPAVEDQGGVCVSSSGELFPSGASWRENPCTSCTCRNSSIQCFTHSCPETSCRVRVLRKNQCCPRCHDASSDHRVTMEPRSSENMSESQRPWIISTTTAPEPTVSAAGKDSLWKDLSFLYQSAVWVLAGILLLLILFLTGVLLVRRHRKSFMNISCFDAPKKTVILKKHVNMSSVLYMEPSRDNSFQTSNASESNGFSIPRAKLASASLS